MAVKAWLTETWLKWALAFMGVALFYHVVAGVRHLLMDCHVGDSREGGRRGAYIVMGLTALFAIYLGYNVW